MKLKNTGAARRGWRTSSKPRIRLATPSHQRQQGRASPWNIPWNIFGILRNIFS